MQIDELLHIAGGLSLKSFAWGPGVVETLNNLFAEAKRITPEITGNQALEILKALPPPALTGILAIRLNVATGRPEGEEPPGETAKSEQKTTAAAKRSGVPLIIAGITTVVAVLMALVMSASSIVHGTTPDEGVLRLIFTTLLEVIKVFMTPDNATPVAWVQFL